jgi:GMP synthase-like glutamine amidotransferase
MKPIAIFRHARTEGPGYFADYLDRRKLPWRLVCIDQGEAVPTNVQEFSGLAFMGGPMSVNDGLPWIGAVLRLIQDAAAGSVPVVGHCLGSQLLSRALGGAVTPNPVKEIGWGQVRVEVAPTARDLFGAIESFDAFHWHGETFTIPPGATRVLSNRWCRNQGFVLGPHIGMQCHVEMTENLVRTWVDGGAAEIADSRTSPAVQPPEEIERDLAARVAALQQVADRIYDRWVAGLKP